MKVVEDTMLTKTDRYVVDTIDLGNLLQDHMKGFANNISKLHSKMATLKLKQMRYKNVSKKS